MWLSPGSHSPCVDLSNSKYQPTISRYDFRALSVETLGVLEPSVLLLSGALSQLNGQQIT